MRNVAGPKQCRLKTRQTGWQEELSLLNICPWPCKTHKWTTLQVHVTSSMLQSPTGQDMCSEFTLPDVVSIELCMSSWQTLQPQANGPILRGMINWCNCHWQERNHFWDFYSHRVKRQRKSYAQYDNPKKTNRQEKHVGEPLERGQKDRRLLWLKLHSWQGHAKSKLADSLQ